ncbi:MAG TPA: hypothetical protein PLW10_24585, partial [Myxococcota bacterium]|nr:hypothetical protein [Myxococcota bacterium]
VVVELEHWQKRLSPRFDLRYEQHSIGGITTPPPRRTGWLAMYPLAAVADVALAVPVGLAFVGAWLLPFVPDFTWVPGSDPNWHRERTRKRQEQEEQAPPLPSGWESPPD